MAIKKISQLPSAASITGSELVPIVQDGTTKQVTSDLLANYTSVTGKVSTADLASTATGKGAALVGFIQSGTGAVARTVQDKGRDIPTLLDFIPPAERAAIEAGTSTYNCTAAMTAAFAAHDAVKATAGLYNISTFTLATGKRLLTDGHATIFQQIAGQAAGTRMLLVGGSNVEIGTMTVRGNIATDTGEQNHAIFVQANSTTGNLDNIRIGDMIGEDIRGDVVYIGQAAGSGAIATNVKVGKVYCDNVLRNGVSIVSCDGVEVESVTGPAVGLFHLDVESNVGSGPCKNIKVGHVKGRMFGLIGPTAADYVDQVEVGTLDLDPSYATDSTPSYSGARQDAFTLRNVKRAKVGHLKVNDYDRCAIFTDYNSGELGCLDLEIGSAYLRNCSLTDTTYNAYINGNSLASNVIRIGYLDIDIQAGKRGISLYWSGSVRSIVATVGTGGSLIRACNDMQIGSVTQVGGILLNACQRISVKGGSFNGERLASTSTACSFENVTATCSVFVFTAGQENHDIRNCTLNGDYYGFGTGIRAYTYPMRFGAYNFWVDTNGRLRRKSSTPSSDTDGAIAWAGAKGATGSRPTMGASDIGFLYLDTTLAAAGKPIWWTGTAWVDSTGTTV